MGHPRDRLGTFLWLKQVGIGDKYVQQDESDQELAFQKAFTLELTFSGLFLLLLFAAVPVLALVYGTPQLLLPGFVACLTVADGALQTPFWIFYRRMDFVRQRTLQAVEPIVGFVVTVALAVAGAGFWALVVGVVAGSLSGAVVAMRTSQYKVRLRWEKGALRSYATFSWPLFVAGASSLVIAQSSILVGTKALGLAAVGGIALASSISDYTNKVDQIVTQTLYPAICAVKDRTDLLFESFVKSNRLALMWGLPFGVAVALFGSDLVTYGIGERWRPAVGIIAAFGLVAALGHIAFNWDAFFRARGETRPIAVWSFVTMLSFVAFAIPLMLWKGLNGFAVGMGIMAFVSLVVRGLYLTKLFDGLQMLRTRRARSRPPCPPCWRCWACGRCWATGRWPSRWLSSRSTSRSRWWPRGPSSAGSCARCSGTCAGGARRRRRRPSTRPTGSAARRRASRAGARAGARARSPARRAGRRARPR